MPFTVTANPGSVPSPQIASPATVVQKAQQVGNPNAAQAGACTTPIISIDQRGLAFSQRSGASGTEFRFDTGTLAITLRQEVVASSAYSPCARQRWLIHENDHVADNRRIMTQMDTEIRNDPFLQGVFLNPQWAPVSTFQATQARVQSAVGDIFRRLTLAAVVARDTPAEYARVQRDIQRNCP
jgi:hypothetical protein